MHSDLKTAAVIILIGLLSYTVCPVQAQHEPALHVGGTDTCVVLKNSAYCWGLLSRPLGALRPIIAPDSLRQLDPGVFVGCGLSQRGRVLCTHEMAGKPRSFADTGSCRRGYCVFTMDNRVEDRYMQVSGGFRHACALDQAHKAYCWGANGMGQLGLGWRAVDSTSSGGAPVTQPSLVFGNETWQIISAGESHTCALTEEGTAYCWGYGQSGQIGRDTVMAPCSGPIPQPNAPCSVDRPIKVQTDVRFLTISAGIRLTCGVSVDRAAYCWGNNYRCALGRCGTPDSPQPTRIPVPGEVLQVDAGYWFACAVTSEHRAYCWGDNTHGQLGSPVSDELGRCFLGGRCSPTPTEVSGNYRWRTVSAGELHACGITVEDEVLCWGSRANGRLGANAGSEICVNDSDTWKDQPCRSTPIRILVGPRR